jgi:DeoR family transcriptional regulator, glycerol-3-phosphate regulon repressor
MPGIDPAGAPFDFDLHEVPAAQTVIERSRQIYLVASHSKVGRSSLVRLEPISHGPCVVHQRASPPAMATVLAEAGTPLHVAGVG